MRGRSSSKNPGVFLSEDTKKAIRWALAKAPAGWEVKTLVQLLDSLGERWDNTDVQISPAQRTFLKKTVLPAVALQNLETLSPEQVRHYDEFRFFCSDKI